ncbi:putative stage III sporulation protein AA [Eubacterium sp. CAG:192]|nr:putative stage III sporulation protein AA [Eubacterium sp. CAG:192]
MAIRSMAPTLIAVDEIGTAQDIEALEYANLSGIFIIATVHGKNQAAVIKKLGKDFVDLFEKKICILNIGEYLCV